VRRLDGGQRKAYGELSNELRRQHEGITALSEHTQQLAEALRARRRAASGASAWPKTCCGSPVCSKASTTASRRRSDGAGRPDYTFLMPNGRVMHMDVKFPLDNYVAILEAGSDLERKQFRDQFLRDVRDAVQGAEDARLPRRARRHRRLPADVHPQRAGLRVRAGERPLSILDDALEHKIVVCSPLTLYAVLAVVRQAVDNFQLERTSSEILALLGEFSRQWEKYAGQLDRCSSGSSRWPRSTPRYDDAAPRVATPPRQDRQSPATRSGGCSMPISRQLTFPELSAWADYAPRAPPVL
jgi:DNA recombination protein RmuC